MKTQENKVEMTCTLTLTETEVAMLAYLASFGGANIGAVICRGLGQKFKEDDWNSLWSALRDETERAKKKFDDTRMVFNGIKRAVGLGD